MYRDKPVSPTSRAKEHSSSSRRRQAKTTKTHSRISQTKTENTKDFKDWVDAGMPDTWQPKSGPQTRSSTREDVGMIAESLMKKRKR